MDNYHTDEFKNQLIPSIAGLSVCLKVSRETVYAWITEEDKSDFSDMVKQMLAEQEIKLLTGGLGGTHNPTIAKLVLNKHNYSDSVKTDITSNGEKMENTITIAPVKVKE
jgi:hypothetical protein